jgi:pyruvate dehydrogenase E2 component (dihydrolipoamide acetyltransferase)
MPTEFQLPDLGENIEGGDVISVLVKEGDVLSTDQPVIELETDKAVIEIPSSVSGRIKEILVKEGGRASVGQPILTVDADSVPAPEAESEPVDAPEDSTEQPPAETRTEPPAAGSQSEPPAAGPSITLPAQGKSVPAAPSVRRLAREIGVDIAQVSGSGPGGRISQEDVKAYSRKLNAEGSVQAVGASPGTAAVPLPDFSQWGAVERRPMSNVRRTTAERLSHAWSTIPHVTQFDKADITDLERWRREFAEKATASGAKLTVTAVVLKVAAAALKVFPQFNASIDMASKEVIFKHYYHVGVAVDTDRGLLVPVVRDVDKKNIVELAVELSRMAEQARSGKITPDEMQGGCFTVSNLGGIGGTAFAPIVNPPQVAILGVARGALEPVFAEGEFKPRLMMPLALSYDHRQIDGADGARFLRWVAQALENPFLLLLEG